jgi:hypothetical protein
MAKLATCLMIAIIALANLHGKTANWFSGGPLL